MLYTVETQTRAPDAWLEVGRAPVTLETVSDAFEAVSSSTEEGIPQASSSPTRRAQRARARSASSICRLGIERY